jgi:hypothetical protein
MLLRIPHPGTRRFEGSLIRASTISYLDAKSAIEPTRLTLEIRQYHIETDRRPPGKDVLPLPVPVDISCLMEEPERVEKLKKQWEHLVYVQRSKSESSF